MPQVSAAVLRSMPPSTSASASIRRAAAPFFSTLAALRSSEAVMSSRVIDTAAPIDAAPLKGQHRVRLSLILESLMSHSFGPLVLYLWLWVLAFAGTTHGVARSRLVSRYGFNFRTAAVVLCVLHLSPLAGRGREHLASG